jgi:OPT family oligopeptide transporter
VVSDDFRFVLPIHIVQRASIFCSFPVHIWCRYYRGVEHTAPCMGFRACPHHLCVHLTCLRCFLSFLTSMFPAFIYTVPIGLIQATTNQQLGLNVITELIIGYALPGRPIAMMLFKTWGYMTMWQALSFTSDFKLGHYMKIPHRPMFWCQIVATVVAGTLQLCVQAWMFSNIEDLCSPDQRDGFTCPTINVFGTASIVVSYHSLAIYCPPRSKLLS